MSKVDELFDKVYDIEEEIKHLCKVLEQLKAGRYNPKNNMEQLERKIKAYEEKVRLLEVKRDKTLKDARKAAADAASDGKYKH